MARRRFDSRLLTATGQSWAALRRWHTKQPTSPGSGIRVERYDLKAVNVAWVNTEREEGGCDLPVGSWGERRPLPLSRS